MSSQTPNDNLAQPLRRGAQSERSATHDGPRGAERDLNAADCGSLACGEGVSTNDYGAGGEGECFAVEGHNAWRWEDGWDSEGEGVCA